MKAFVILLSASLAFAQLDVKGFVHWNQLCPDLADLGVGSKVVLDGGAYQAYITKQGNFTIPQVPSGSYSLSVVSHSHVFDAYQVDVGPSEVQVRTYVPGTPMIPVSALNSYPTLSYPIALTPRANYRASGAYFVPRESFNLLAMFSNPMMLMMLFAGVMVLAMPYLMKNLEDLDPEAAQEMKAHQAKITGVQNALSQGDFKAGFSQLLSNDEQSSPASTNTRTATPSKGKGKSGQKRK